MKGVHIVMTKVVRVETVIKKFLEQRTENIIHGPFKFKEPDMIGMKIYGEMSVKFSCYEIIIFFKLFQKGSPITTAFEYLRKVDKVSQLNLKNLQENKTVSFNFYNNEFRSFVKGPDVQNAYIDDLLELDLIKRLTDRYQQYLDNPAQQYFPVTEPAKTMEETKDGT